MGESISKGGATPELAVQQKKEDGKFDYLLAESRTIPIINLLSNRFARILELFKRTLSYAGFVGEDLNQIKLEYATSTVRDLFDLNRKYEAWTNSWVGNGITYADIEKKDYNAIIDDIWGTITALEIDANRELGMNFRMRDEYHSYYSDIVALRIIYRTVLEKITKPPEPKKEKKTEKWFNEAEAKRLGLSRQIVNAYVGLDELMERVYFKETVDTIDIKTEYGKREFLEEWDTLTSEVMPPCSDTKESGGFDYITAFADGLVRRDYYRSFPAFDETLDLLVEDWKEIDENDIFEEDFERPRSALLRELGLDDDIFNVKVDRVESALYTVVDEMREKTATHRDILVKLGLDPAQYEIRFIAYDEYTRLANKNGWGSREMWTVMSDRPVSNNSEWFMAGRLREGGPSAIVKETKDYLFHVGIRLVVAPLPA